MTLQLTILATYRLSNFEFGGSKYQSANLESWHNFCNVSLNVRTLLFESREVQV